MFSVSNTWSFGHFSPYSLRIIPINSCRTHIWSCWRSCNDQVILWASNYNYTTSWSLARGRQVSPLAGLKEPQFRCRNGHVVVWWFDSSRFFLLIRLTFGLETLPVDVDGWGVLTGCLWLPVYFKMEHPRGPWTIRTSTRYHHANKKNGNHLVPYILVHSLLWLLTIIKSMKTNPMNN